MSGANITAFFTNNTSDAAAFVIYDRGIDPNAPRQVFGDYLTPGASTPELTLWSPDGIYGHVTYVRSGGAPQVLDTVTNGSTVPMA